MLAVALPGLLLWSWSRPQPAPPREVPPLALRPSAVAEQIRLDEAAAAAEPESEHTELRRDVYTETNTAEIEANDYPPTVEDRRRRLHAAVAAAVEAHGQEVIAEMRAADVQRMERALRGELGPNATTAELGAFIRMMERYAMASGGRQLAPRFVVRTAFKARWNAMHGREATEGFSDVELRAHWGWLALQAQSAPMAMRLEALEHYAQAGGPRAGEARGVLLYQAGRTEEAAEAFRAAHAARPSFRMRNHAIFASASGEDR